jgi:TolB protein
MPGMIAKLTLLAVASAAAAGLVTTDATAAPKLRIVFDRATGSSDYHVLSIKPSGDAERTINDDTTADDWGPDVAPNGRHLAFASRRDADGNNEIFTMRSDGTQVRQRTHTAEDYNEWPDYSRDGKWIVFDGDRKGDDLEILKMHPDGSHLRQLTHNNYDDYGAQFSPNGRKIAFSSERDGDYEVFTMRSNGHDQHQLTHNPAADELPSWFPGGRAVVFNSDRDGDQEIFRIGAGGRHLRQLTHNGGRDDAADVSPNGERIVYERVLSSGFDDEIFTMDANGRHRHQVTDNDLTDEYPAWGRLR